MPFGKPYRWYLPCLIMALVGGCTATSPTPGADERPRVLPHGLPASTPPS